MDNKSFDLSRAADLMMSWGKQTAPLTIAEQAHRTSEIYKILRLHYPDEANDPVCSPALRVSAGEAKSGSVGCHDSWSPSLAQRPRTHSNHEHQQTALTAHTPHCLPVNSIHTGKTPTTSSVTSTPVDPGADHGYSGQAPGSSGDGHWTSAQWADWAGRWDGWRVYGPTQTDLSTHVTARPTSPLLLPPPLLLPLPPRSKVRP